jgi:predicted nucleic acid-binding Zn ribbon protein
MRRLAPRPLRLALERSASRAAPVSLLAGVQAVWSEVAGAAVAEEAEPVSERDGVVTIACRSAVWAQELELLAGDLEERLRARLGDAAKGLELRFRTASGARS